MSATITPRVAAQPYSRIVGIGSYRPERVVTNDEICQYVDSSDEWIRERTGIVERRFAAPGESVVDMASAAAEKALAHAGITADQIGAIVLATVTHIHNTPAAATEVADRIGAVNAGAFDLSAACSGFCYALGIADGLVRNQTADYALVIGVERLTDYVSPSDRGSAFIFADGAGAVVVGPSATVGIGPTIWGSDGSQKDAIIIEPSWIDFRTAISKGEEVAEPWLTMQGQAVFRWAVGTVPRITSEILAASGMTIDDIDAFVPHQANNRITDAIVRSLGLPDRVVVARDIITAGNTSGASVPLALDALVASGEVASGDIALLVGFGAGLAYAGQIVVVP